MTEKYTFIRPIFLLAFASLSGCATNGILDNVSESVGNQECSPGFVISQNDTSTIPSPKQVVRGVGYGAPPKLYYPPPQRRLMALRAAKADAYRDLAEKIGGVHIQGDTTISDMVVHSDKLRVYIDTHIKNATVVALNPLEDSSYEAIVEVAFDSPVLDAKTVAEHAPQCVPIEKTIDSQAPATSL